MRFLDAVDEYVYDARSSGRMTSDNTERHYRDVLGWHGEDIDFKDPRFTDRDNVKATLRRWTNPNTYRTRRATLVSFYDWMMEEGHRPDNPARQTRSVRRKPVSIYRLTYDEVREFLHAADTTREQRVAYLGVCAGLRLQELRGLRGSMFGREDWIHVTKEIAKGGRERWVPVIPDLADVVEEIRRNVDPDHHVISSVKSCRMGTQRHTSERPERPSSPQVVYRIVQKLGLRAGIQANVHPHLMRHAFADHVARKAGLHIAQALMGHADVSTTQEYLGGPILDELSHAVADVSFLEERVAHVLSPTESP